MPGAVPHFAWYLTLCSTATSLFMGARKLAPIYGYPAMCQLISRQVYVILQGLGASPAKESLISICRPFWLVQALPSFSLPIRLKCGRRPPFQNSVQGFLRRQKTAHYQPNCGNRSENWTYSFLFPLAIGRISAKTLFQGILVGYLSPFQAV